MRSFASAALVVGILGLTACGGLSDTAPETVAEPRAPVEAEASVDKAVATTGDVLTFRVTVDHDPSLAVEIPEAGAEIQGFRIVDISRQEPAEVNGRLVRELVYRLRADLVGSYILPSVAVGYRPADDPEAELSGVVETSQIFVEVESVLPTDGSAEDILEIKPLRQIERERSWWMVALAVGIAALLGLVAWRTFRRRGEVVLTPPEPAHVVAFRSLDALRATDFDDPQAVRRFYYAISEVVRVYVEGRFGLNATDMTTEEILGRLPEVGDLSETGRSRLGSFLVHADQVKFAEYQPSEAEIRETYEGALGFVEATQPRPEAEPGEEELAA